MKRVLAIFIAVLALVHIAGITPFYIAALQFIKQEVTVELSDVTQLTPIQVTHTELADAALFTRLEEGEFIYRGKLYDYKQIKHTNEGITFYALEDEKESALKTALNLIYNQQVPGKDQSPLGKLMKEFSKDYTLANTPTDLSGCLCCKKVFAFSNHLSHLMKGHQHKLINPPDNGNTHA